MNIYEIINKYDTLTLKSKRHSFLQIKDDEHMVIECCRGIKVFDENTIILELAKCSLSIIGLNLRMKNYNKETVEIRGKFNTIKFEELNRKENRNE